MLNLLHLLLFWEAHVHESRHLEKETTLEQKNTGELEAGCGLPSEARHSKNTSGLNSCFLNI